LKKSIKYSIGRKISQNIRDSVPGPGTYSPDLALNSFNGYRDVENFENKIVKFRGFSISSASVFSESRKKKTFIQQTDKPQDFIKNN
jgi:hypothetical protein